MKKPMVSLILPVYNEQARLLPGLRQAVMYLQKQSYPWEIILVDDGSDRPVVIKNPSVTVMRLVKNSGKGAAIRSGVKSARGKFIIFSDIDFSVPVETIAQMLKALKTSPVVIASRRAPGASLGKHQPIFRETAGRIFTFIANTMLGIRVFDITCGFKGFERRVAKRLFRDLITSRWVFDAEVLWRARRFGMPITEIPVRWSDKKGTHVHFFDVLHAWGDLMKLWIYATLFIR
jgi:dolichyl-phosphate beta-glucosyltransferase